MADGNNSNSAIWIAVIGLITTISGGVFSQWHNIFAKADPEVVSSQTDTASSAQVQGDTATPVDDAASASTASDNAASDPAN